MTTEPFTNADVFVRAGLADSAGHVRRLAAQGALFVDSCKITKPDDVFASEVPDGISDWVCLGVGSRRRWVQVYSLNLPEPMMWDEPSAPKSLHPGFVWHPAPKELEP